MIKIHGRSYSIKKISAIHTIQNKTKEYFVKKYGC